MFNRRWGCRLNELQDARKHRKAGPSPKENKELSALAGMLNANAGVMLPKELPAPAAIRVAAPVVTLEPAQAISTQQTPATPLTAGAASSKIFLTGRMKVGKDYLAAAAGFKILALADPIYVLAEYFFGEQPKDLTRTFLQTAGQWGRGTVSAEYPLTPERAMFVKLVRETIQDGRHSVNWSAYGQSENIWLDALVARAKAEPPGTRLAVSGVRFQNEYLRLVKEGFQHWHVMTSPASWAARLKVAGLTPESPAVKDFSEQLASSLDANVTKQLSTQRGGAKLSCVWSDSKVVPPSGRLLTVGEFVALFPKI